MLVNPSLFAKVVSEHLNTGENLCDIIERSYSEDNWNEVMDLCEGLFPLMVKTGYDN